MDHRTDNPLTKAYEDAVFLRRDELRSVRLQTELLKAQLILDEGQVASTVVVFGSARTPSPEDAEAALAAARTRLQATPDDEAAKARGREAERAVQSSHYYAMAREFAAKISRFGQTEVHADGTLEYVVMTGGGPGIMEAANRGAADVGAKSVGLNITLPHEQHPNPYISPEFNFTFHYFSIRKMHFLIRAKGLCAFPGGFGTMDELFETLTLTQTGKTARIPVLLFGRDFWERLLDWQVFLDEGMISEEDLDLFHYVESADEGVARVKEFYGH